MAWQNKTFYCGAHNINPCFKAFFTPKVFFVESASATSGVIAVAKPIPKDIAIKKKLLPSETAANSAAPNWPTIMLSAKETNTCPSIPKITGSASFKL